MGCSDSRGWDAGAYEVTASAVNFADFRGRVVVRVAETASLSVTLKVQGVVADVSVNASPIDRSSNVISNPVTDHQIQNTPLAQRSFANIAFIAPMTAPVEPSDPTKARITAVSFAGSSGLNLDLSVDGGDNNDDYIGFLQNYSPESIREFNVRTAQFDADTSRTNGGSVIISTQSGGNLLRGSASGYFRTGGLNARNELDNPEPNPKQPYSKQDYVGSLGGPIQKDHLWFFTSYEYNRENPSVVQRVESLGI